MIEKHHYTCRLDASDRERLSELSRRLEKTPSATIRLLINAAYDDVFTRSSPVNTREIDHGEALIHDESTIAREPDPSASYIIDYDSCP